MALLSSTMLLLALVLLSISCVQSIYVEIISAFGNPLTAELDGSLVLNRESVSEWEVWDLEPHPDGTISLKSAHGKYLSGDPDGHITADRDHIGVWERFVLDRPKKDDVEKVSFQSVHHYYLCANHDRLEPRGNVGDWETFTLRILQRGDGNQDGQSVSEL